MTTESLAKTAEPLDVLALLTGDGAPPAEHIPVARRMQIVWKGSKNIKDDAIAAGYTVPDTGCLVGLSAGGVSDYSGFNPFQFFLVQAKQVQIKCNNRGEVIDYKVQPEEAEGYRQSYVVLGVAVRGRQLVPFVAGLGRLAGGQSAFVRQALIIKQGHSGDLSNRGPAFAIPAGIKAEPFRVLFRLSGTPSESDNGEYLKTKVSYTLANQELLDILAENEVTTPGSNFVRDMQECAKVYQQELTKTLDK